MSKRVLALVQRAGNGANVTDKTPVAVWDHEVPILEEIHGEGAVEVINDIEDLLDNSVTKNRRKVIDDIISARQLGEVFAGDPFEEYQRMGMKYGAHTEVRMSNVEKVYGSFRDGAFTRACGTQGEEYEEMPVTQLRTLCDELGIAYKASDKRVHLAAAIREVKHLEAA